MMCMFIPPMKERLFTSVTIVIKLVIRCQQNHFMEIDMTPEAKLKLKGLLVKHEGL